MKETNRIKTLTDKLCDDFSFCIQQSEFDLDNINPLDVIKNKLTDRIIELLEDNTETLVGILYKIEISEETVKKIFTVKNADQFPEQLAGLIISKQLQKLKN